MNFATPATWVFMTAVHSIDRADEISLLAVLGMVVISYLAWLLGLGSQGLSMLTALLLAGAIVLMGREIASGRWLAPLILVCLFVIAAGSPTGDWDARSIWLFHAKRIYIDHSLASQLDGYASWSHNDYPVLVPAVSASLASLLGHWNEAVPKLAGPLVMAPALIVLARRLTFTGMAAWLVLLLFCAGKLLVNGYLDAVLGVYFVAAFALARELRGTGDEEGGNAPPVDYRAIATACLVFVVLTLLKNEGLFALGAIVGSVIVVALSQGRRPQRHFVLVLVLAIVPILHWKWLANAQGVSNYLINSNMGSHALARLQEPSSLLRILESMFLAWPVLLPISLSAFFAWRFRRDPRCQAAVLAVGAYSAIIFCAYLSTPMDLAWHLQTSVDRVMLPVSLLLGYEVARFAGLPRGP